MTSDGPGDSPGEPGMWQQFRRRRVIRTVLLYVSLMFLGIEAYLITAQYIAFPLWGFRAVVGVAVLGFPLTVVLAWAYDVTPSGIVKTPEDLGPEPPSTPQKRAWILVSLGAIIAGLVLRFLRA